MAIDPGSAMLASTGANILAGAFSGNGSGTANLNMRRERKQRRGLYELENENIPNRLKATVEGAKAAGLHPLFALGSGSAQGGGNFSIPGGQSRTGSFKKDALSAIGSGFQQIAQIQAKTDLVEKMAELEKIQQADREVSNDTAAVLPLKGRHPALSQKPARAAKASGGLAEYKPAEIGSHVKGNPQMSGNVKSLTSGIRIGDQVVQTIADEPSDIADDPVMIIGAAMLDKNNRHVDFKKVIRDFAGWRHPLDYKKAMQTERTITRELFGGLIKLKRHYQITPGQGR